MIHIIKGTQTITLSGCGFDVEKGTLYYNSGSELIAYDIATGVRETVLNVNINDWKFVNDHFGDEESDRLIKTIADILKKEAKPEVEESKYIAIEG